MEMTQKKVVSLLVAGNGRVKYADLLGWFKVCFDSSDPAEKKRNRDLFKGLVNRFAVVREIDGVKYVVLRTKYGHLLTEGPGMDEHDDEPRQPGEHTPARCDKTTVNNGDEGGGGGGGSVYSASAETQLTASPVSGANSEENKHHSPAASAASAIELALQRSSFSDLKVRRALHFERTGQGSDEHNENRSRESATPASPPPPPPCVHKTHVPSSTSKGYGLPLRMPPTEIHPPKTPQSHGLSPRPGVQAVKVSKPSQEEPAVRNPRFSSAIPLETLKGHPQKTPQSHGWSPPPGVQAVKVSKPSQEEPAVRNPRFSSAIPLETLKGHPQKTPQSHGSPPPLGGQAVKVSKPCQEEPAVRNPRFSSTIPLETLKGHPQKTPQSHGPSPPPGVQAVKVSKPSQEEPAVREPRFPSAAPLEPSEHAWLVKSAAGLWDQVYGLLLQDNQLVEKRDFMSGFTALHWAAKCGNSEILAKMIRVSRERGADVDVNARTHGGYTPLHIAALHDQEYVLGMLAGEFGADVRLRDNCGKRAYHYLHGGITGRVRELLGEPRPAQPPPEQEVAAGQQQQEREDMDLFQDLSKGLHTISRLFQPHAASTHRKRHKHRPEFYSLSEEPREESE